MSLIAVGSGKGSPGCTFVAINLAAAIAASVGEALLVDLDPNGADISAYLGLDPRRGLYPLMRLEGRVPSQDSLLREAESRGGLLCIGGFSRGEDADIEMIRTVLDVSREAAVTVVADLGRVSSQTADLFAKADLVLIAVRPDLIGTFGAQRALEALKGAGVAEAKAGAVITGWEWRRAGRYELMLVYKVDRLARSVSGLAHILEELQSAGVGFRSASEPFDTSTAAGRMMVQMLGVFAEFEREMIVERTKMGLAKKASKGEWTGGKAPFGYGYDSERRLLTLAEEEAPVIKAIFDRYTDAGWGSMAIAKWLNEKCDLTRSGAKWTPQRIISILRNPTYIGLLPFGGEVYEAFHERLVESDQFERAGALLQERGEAWARRASNPSDYLLTGFLRCKKCNHGFVGTAAHGRSSTYRYYTCFSRQRHGTSTCDQDRLPADRLEERILSAILAELDDGSIFERAAELGRADWDATNSGRAAEISRLEKKIGERRGALDRYLKAFESSHLSAKTCAHRVKEVEKELAVLEAEKSTLEAQDEPPAVNMGQLSTLRSEIERTIRDGAPQDIKELLADCLDSIVVDSRKFVQPFYCLPAVRIVSSSRRRTGIEPAHRLSSAHQF